VVPELVTKTYGVKALSDATVAWALKIPPPRTCAIDDDLDRLVRAAPATSRIRLLSKTRT